MSPPKSKTDDGHATGFDEQVLYVVVRKAVEDAILGAIGSIVQIVVSIFIIWFGVMVAFSGQSTAASMGGIVVVGIGLSLAALAMDIIPPVQNWF